MHMVDAVLFDLDGTLVETNIDFPLMKREMVALAINAGADLDDVRGLDILAVIDHTVDKLKSRDLHSEATTLHRRAMAILEEIELTHADAAREIPFAREIVTELKAHGIGVGIVTRSCRTASETSLRFAGIEPDVMLCREDTLHHKPHPEPLMVALNALCAKPEAAIMVGDHIMDIQGGKAAGLKTVGFLHNARPSDFFENVSPDFVARSLKEVLHAIIDCDC